MVSRKLRVGVGLVTLTVAALGDAQHARRPVPPVPPLPSPSHAIKLKAPSHPGTAASKPPAAQVTANSHIRPRIASLREDVDDYNRSHPIAMPVFGRAAGPGVVAGSIAPDANQPIALRLSGAPYEH
jgi:hypothetical protein